MHKYRSVVSTTPDSRALRSEQLCLLGVELLVGQHTLVAQCRQLVDLLGDAGGGSGGSLNVLARRLVSGDSVAMVAMRHPAPSGDQVHEDAEERQDDDEDRPQRLGPSAQVIAAEDVH